MILLSMGDLFVSHCQLIIDTVDCEGENLHVNIEKGSSCFHCVAL